MQTVFSHRVVVLVAELEVEGTVIIGPKLHEVTLRGSSPNYHNTGNLKYNSQQF